MHLAPGPYEMIMAGRKTMEPRLYDPKRRLLRSGDEIDFSLLEGTNDNVITAIIQEILVFSSFDELYGSVDLERCGYASSEVERASPDDMLEYCSIESQMHWGVVAIRFYPIPK